MIELSVAGESGHRKEHTMDEQRDYAEEAYNLATMYEDGVECENCSAWVPEDESTDDGLCSYCAGE